MKKLATLCLSVVFGAATLFAGAPAKRMASPDLQSQLQPKPIVHSPNAAKSAKSANYGFESVTSTNTKARLHSAVKSKAPMRIGDNGGTVYGYLAYDEEGTTPLGFAEVFLNGGITNLMPEFTGPSGYDFDVTCLYMREGNVYVIGDETLFGSFYLGTFCLEYDMEGNLVNQIEYASTDVVFNYVAYDPVNDKLYGYVENDGLYFATAPGDQPNAAQIVAEVPTGSNVGAMTYNQVSGKIIGIQGTSLGGNVLEISPIDGTPTVVATLDKTSQYITALAYSPMDLGYYYAICSDDGCGIALLDETTFEEKSYTEYDSLMEFFGFVCPDTQKILDNAPGESTLVNTIFGNGALSGSLTYKLATLTHAGTPILGDIDWLLEIDGVEYQRGKGAAGSNVVINVNDLSEGLHTFVFKASLGGNFGRYLYTTFYVGNDTPSAPAKVTLDEETITWTPVETGVHEGYVNPEEITYNVYLNGKNIAKGLKATGCASQLPAGELIDGYVASVEAVFDGKTSEMAYSNDLAYGDPYTLPVNFEPTEKESRVFTIIDSNDDNNGIVFTHLNLSSSMPDEPAFIYQYDQDNDADEWLFLPATSYPDANAVYEFSMNCFRLARYQENVEVKLCSAPDPDAEVSTLIEDTEITNAYSTEEDMLSSILTADFSVPSAGVYYIGVHVISPADQYVTVMRDFNVKAVDGMTINNPASVSNLSAVAAPGGALTATVTFTMPTTAYNGVPYAADKDLSAVVAVEGGDEVSASGKPGETVTVTVTTKQGLNEISVVAKDGDKAGIPATVNVYTGVERPGTVVNLTAKVDATDYSVHLTWDAPEEGVDGGYVAPTGIKYSLCEYLTTSQGTGWYITQEIGTDVMSYDYELPEGTDQSLVRLGILAENFVGQGDYLKVAYAVMGQPYELPAVCNVNAGQLLNPVVSWGNFSVASGNPSTKYPEFTTEDNSKALYTVATEEIEDAYITLPKFSTKTTKTPAIKLNVYGGSADFTVVANAYGIKETVLKSFTAADFATAGPQTVEIDLPANFIGKNWVEIGIYANISAEKSFILYGYQYFDNLPFDFGVTAIEGPAKATIGDEASYVAHITNFGSDANMLPASNWTLVSTEGEVVANINVPAGTEAIASGDETTVNIAFSPTAEQLGDYTLTYTIDKADNKQINDSFTKELSVVKGLIPVVTDLTAKEITFDEVTLAWTPVTSSSNVVDSFEEETPFVLDDASDMIGQFKRVDGDKCHVYGSQASGFANIPGAYGPSSFLLWSQKEVEEILGSSGTFAAKTGDQFLIAFSPSEPEGNPQAADDWLISPEVSGGSEVSFSIRPITYQYGAEVVEFMYSTTGDNPSDFKRLKKIQVSGDSNATSTTWADYSFTLPENAKYFAIHYVSTDIFGIMLDDIAYAPAGAGSKLAGYDIYRDGSVIAASAPCEDGTYIDNTVAENTAYTYMVMPVLTDGTKGMESNILTLRTTGVDGVMTGSKAILTKKGEIVVRGYEGANIVIVSTDGKVVASDSNAPATKTFTLGAGIYVVKAGKDVMKVIVK